MKKVQDLKSNLALFYATNLLGFIGLFIFNENYLDK